MATLDRHDRRRSRSQAHRPWPRVDRGRGRLAPRDRRTRRRPLDAARPVGRRRRRAHGRAATRRRRDRRRHALPVRDGRFPSVGALHPPAIRLERAIRDLYGLEPVGLPDARPWLDHGFWDVQHPLGDARSAAPASARRTRSCRPRARACTRSRSVRCMPASSSPAISASPPTARPSCGWKSASATSTRASSR